MTTALIIANAAAGSADDEALGGVLDALRGEWEVQLARTGSPDELTAALEAHAGTDVVVVAGGDGSLHATIQALYDLELLSSTTLALVPMGTGNDFARTLDLPDDPVAVARTMLDATAVPTDIAVDDEGTVVVNAVHVGLGAQAGREAEPWKKRLGPIGYVIGAVKAGVFGTPGHIDVSVDGQRVDGEGRIVQAAVGIGRYVGGGAPLLPDADPSDGLLAVVVAHADPPLRRLSYGLRLLRGTHTHSRDVVTTQGTSVTVSGGPMVWNADGEVEDGLRERTWRIVPAAYQRLKPRRDLTPLEDS